MRWSQLLIPTLREDPAEAEAVSHRLMIRGGFIRQLAAGIYVYLPLGQRVIEKINTIIREEMNRIGGQEITLPALHPAELWQQSSRWSEIGEEMFRLKDRGKRDLCLGMTHEEVIAWLAAKEIRSYRELPQIWYQIQTKFRDEARPKGGVLRTREFLMKDSYSLDATEEGLHQSYELHKEAYRQIFARCGLRFHVVESDPGMMGGASSHEFMAPSASGEDEIALCASCGYAANVELTKAQSGDACGKCGGMLTVERVIEVGNTFQLGTKYSLPLKAVYLDEQGQERPIVMGSYGIGPARIAAAAIEQNHDPDGIIWPLPITPFQIHLLTVNVKDERMRHLGEEIYRDLAAAPEVLYDDRDERPGVKFKDADLIGIPYRVTVGNRTVREGKIEVRNRRTKEEFLLSVSEVPPRLREMLTQVA